MTTIRSITVSWILALLSAGGCVANETAEITKGAPEIGAQTKEERASYVINSEAGSVAGISVGMTETEIREAGWPYETRSEILEGDEYKIYDLRLTGDTRLKCTLDLENTLYRIESSSAEIRDEHGLGVGSQLSELKRSYPTGRLIRGTAEGRFVNFLTGTRLIFRFDHHDLEESCFDYKDCTIDDAIAVKSIVIGKHAPK